MLKVFGRGSRGSGKRSPDGSMVEIALALGSGTVSALCNNRGLPKVEALA